MKWTIFMQSSHSFAWPRRKRWCDVRQKVGVSLLKIDGLPSLLVVYALEHSEDGASFFV